MCIMFTTSVCAVTPPPINRQSIRSAQDYQVITPRIQEFYHHHQPPTIRPEPTAAPEQRRSDRCLIHNLAEFNNVTAECFLIAEHGSPKNKTYTYELLLGSERYQNTSIGKQKACQSLAEHALQNTRYVHPPLRKRTCAIVQTSVSLLQEWAQRRNLIPYYEITNQAFEPEREYTIECSLGLGFKTDGRSDDKKTAKSIAADKMWERIHDMNIPIVIGTKSIDQYNTTEAMRTHPVSRLYEIQKARKGYEPVFNVINRDSLPTGNRQNVHIVQMEAKIEDMRVVGQGKNNRQAKADAAEKLLRQMGFLVAST